MKEGTHGTASGALDAHSMGDRLCAVLQLADLEQKWGMTLLERSKSGVCLTSAGEPVRPFLLLEHSGKA